VDAGTAPGAGEGAHAIHLDHGPHRALERHHQANPRGARARGGQQQQQRCRRRRHPYPQDAQPVSASLPVPKERGSAPAAAARRGGSVQLFRLSVGVLWRRVLSSLKGRRLMFLEVIFLIIRGFVAFCLSQGSVEENKSDIEY
jgi:hypothetical protein